MTDELVRALEALVVRPDEVLIVRVADAHAASSGEVTRALEAVGLGSRSLVFVGEFEFSKVARDQL